MLVACHANHADEQDCIQQSSFLHPQCLRLLLSLFLMPYTHQIVFFTILSLLLILIGKTDNAMWQRQLIQILWQKNRLDNSLVWMWFLLSKSGMLWKLLLYELYLLSWCLFCFRWRVIFCKLSEITGQRPSLCRVGLKVPVIKAAVNRKYQNDER